MTWCRDRCLDIRVCFMGFTWQGCADMNGPIQKRTTNVLRNVVVPLRLTAEAFKPSKIIVQVILLNVRRS